MKRAMLCLPVLALLCGCQGPGFADRYAQTVAQAHGADTFYANRAIRADIKVEFGQKTMLEGSMLFETSGARARLDLLDGSAVVFDGTDAWVSPADSPFKGGRFHVLTWPYFLAVPMKLSDPGTHLEDRGPRHMQDKVYSAARLTFDPGTGDAPDDWYLLYVDRASHELRAMAYIVTYSTDKAEAQKNPHAITYDGFISVGGGGGAVPSRLATQWTFWNWSAKESVHGQPIGRAQLSNVRFVNPSPQAFIKPQDARVDALPGE